jgi:hypothetical protein
MLKSIVASVHIHTYKSTCTHKKNIFRHMHTYTHTHTHTHTPAAPETQPHKNFVFGLHTQPHKTYFVF